MKSIAAKFFFAAIYTAVVITVFILCTAEPNTQWAIATGRIDFSAAWFYRFRSAAHLAKTAPPLIFHVFQLVPPAIFWGGLILLQGLALVRWKATALHFLAATGILILLAATLFTPGDFIMRQKVLGGSSFLDALTPAHHSERIPVRESCHAAINGHDMRGISSLEHITQDSLRIFSAITLIDLKIVPENYKLLSLKNDKGEAIFSEMARAFAVAETGYAEKKLPILLAAPMLCLIANFDTPPQNETPPYSRARQIFEARKKSGLDTKIIQLPAGFSSR